MVRALLLASGYLDTSSPTTASNQGAELAWLASTGISTEWLQPMSEKDATVSAGLLPF
jgi:hypothetical protein